MERSGSFWFWDLYTPDCSEEELRVRIESGWPELSYTLGLDAGAEFIAYLSRR